MIEVLTLVALAAILTFVILDDLRNFRIRNEAVMALAVLYLASTVLTGHVPHALAHAAFACTMTAVVLIFYARGATGGGDVKLLGVAFLWLGVENSFVFSLLLVGFTLAYALLARLFRMPRRVVAQQARIPFGPCIGAAWLLTTIPWDRVSSSVVRVHAALSG